MIKTLALGILTLAFSFFVGISYINAQEATETPTTSPTVTEEADEEEEEDIPTAAPQTGFGY